MPHSIISLSAVGYPSLYLIPTTLRQILSNLSSISPGSYFFLLPSSWEFFPLSCVRSSLSRILYLLSLFISLFGGSHSKSILRKEVYMGGFIEEKAYISNLQDGLRVTFNVEISFSSDVEGIALVFICSDIFPISSISYHCDSSSYVCDLLFIFGSF